MKDMVLKNREDLQQLHEETKKLVAARDAEGVAATGGIAAGAREVLVCGGTGCISGGSKQVQEAFAAELEKNKLAQEIKIVETGCHGFCEMGTLVTVYPGGAFYARVKPEDVPEIVEEHLLKGQIVNRLLYRDPVTGEQILTYNEIPFYKKQHRVALRNCGEINPENIQESIARGGYEALAKVLFEMTPEQVIDEIKLSGLRGRGGGGFPTGMKWEFCRKSPGDLKYLICNADEGDPGAFMDRSVLEGDPHSVLEGMGIAAYAIGCREGYIYCRAEYPLAIRRLTIAIAQAEELGLLGDNILGTNFSFHLHIKEGAGAFVCGEETALIASIEGSVGEPRQRPPYPAQSGLWGKPTNINNVKTLANIPLIITRGNDWFSKLGTERSKGTVVFSLVGKVNNTGLVEAPMGIKVGSLVFDIGGGIPGGKQFKAVQTGGPSGGCIPAQLAADLSADYETLAAVGSIIGSGGMVVMDEDTCMVNVAKYFLSFTVDEACGKCTPCREGTRRMLEILTDITEGRGKEGDIELLEQMAKTIIDSSLCGLGGTAPNPVLTTIRYFRSEYEAHIRDRRCPAKQCKTLITYRIDPDRCNGCDLCARRCPAQCISGERKKPHQIDQAKCLRCNTCFEVCPTKYRAIVVE